MHMEIYKPFDNHSIYLISNYGNIKNIKTHRILSVNNGKHRYCYVNLVDDNGKSNTHSVHVLVAKTFMSNPENKPHVNHIDMNKKNNHVSNLEWVTRSENMIHAVQNGKKPGKGLSKKCKVILPNEEIKIFDSFTDASDHFGFSKECLSLASKKDDQIYNSHIKKGLTFKIEVIEDSYDESIEWHTILIDGYRHLEISKMGIVRNKKTKKQIKGGDDGRYIRIAGDKLVNNRSLYIHRILALMFIPNPENKPNVNHKDGNTFNNNLNNLEWVTQSENIKHAIETGLMNNNKKSYSKIYQLELDGTIIKEINGIINAEKLLNEESDSEKRTAISNVCSAYMNEDFLTSHGYGWCHVEDYDKSFSSKHLIKLFPELINKNDIKYDLVRNSVIENCRPIWQIDLDGQRINQFASMNLTAQFLNANVRNISTCLQNNNCLVNGYSFRYVSYDDLADLNSQSIKNIPNKIKKIFNITDDNTIIHPKIVKLLKENISTDGSLTIKTPPVVQESMDGIFINIFSGPAKAREYLNLGRESVEAVLRGKNQSSGGFKFRYIQLYDSVLDLI